MPACAVLWPDLPEHGPGYGSVVEGEDVGTDDLVCLVALAGDDDHVAGSGPGEGAADCGLPVGDCLMPVHGQTARYAGHDLGDDGLRLLASRVVGGDPHAIAEPRADGAHEGPLATSTVPAWEWSSAAAGTVIVASGLPIPRACARSRACARG